MPGRSTLLTRHLKDWAVYWGNPVANAVGSYDFAAPIEFRVRWQDVKEAFTDVAGDERISSAVVELPQAVVAKGFLYRGRLTDLSSGGLVSPYEQPGSWEIAKYDETSNINGKRVDRRCYL